MARTTVTNAQLAEQLALLAEQIAAQQSRPENGRVDVILNRLENIEDKLDTVCDAYRADHDEVTRLKANASTANSLLAALSVLGSALAAFLGTRH